MRVSVFASGRVTAEAASGSPAAAVLAEGSGADEAGWPVLVLPCERLLVLLPGLLLVVATELRPLRGTGSVWEVQRTAAASLARPGTRLAPLEHLFHEGGWFFSDSEDLSARGEGQPPRPRYVFNWSTWSSPAARPWSGCLIWGFVGCSEGCTLVARRATEGAGVRFRRRGALEGGHACNFVELEQKVGCCSFVQVRGSVPLAWGQDSSGTEVNPAIVLEEDEGRQRRVLGQHLAQLEREYGRVSSVSLLRQSDAGEAALHGRLEQLLRELPQCPPLLAFDLHARCEGSGVRPLRAFAAGLPLEVGTQQRTVLRTNCKDSVDRTGLLQAQVFELALPTQLREAGRGGERLSLRALYAECNSRLSVAYCGTAAFCEEIARGGERRSRLGRARDALLGALRYHCNAWLDEEKQWAVDALAGNADSLARLQEREQSGGLLWRLRPRPAHGHVAGPLHLLAFLCYILLFVLFFRGKK